MWVERLEESEHDKGYCEILLSGYDIASAFVTHSNCDHLHKAWVHAHMAARTPAHDMKTGCRLAKEKGSSGVRRI